MYAQDSILCQFGPRNLSFSSLTHFSINSRPFLVGIVSVRFYADNGVVVGTEADLVQGLLDEMMDAFAQMGVRVDHGKTKWMLVARSK